MNFASVSLIDLISLAAQYLVIPILGWIWLHDRRLSLVDREIARLITILEEREAHRVETDARDNQVMVELKEAINKLNDRLDRIKSN